MQDLIEVIYHPSHVSQWDPMITHAKFEPIIKDNFTMGLNWTKHRKNFHVSSRDYCDKVFSFVDGNKYYFYSSTIPDEYSTTVAEKDKDTVRGQTIYNMGTLHRDPSTNKIHYQSYVQIDPKVHMPPFILQKFLPSMIKDWYKGINQHYCKHFN